VRNLADNPLTVDLNRVVVDATADALIAAGGTGKIVLWNAAARRLLSYRRDQAVGQTLVLIITSASRPVHVDGFRRAFGTGHTDIAGSPAIVRATRADGVSSEAEMTIGLITDATGTIVGAVAGLRPAGPWQSHRCGRHYVLLIVE